jgi:hypothetical protein
MNTLRGTPAKRATKPVLSLPISYSFTANNKRASSANSSGCCCKAHSNRQGIQSSGSQSYHPDS